MSIIIPTFNGASRINNCLDALLKQTAERDAEILVINDGSTDNTADVVTRHAGIRLVSQANAGPAAARNRGASEARGTIILFTDDDCVPMPNWLDAMIKPFDDPEVVGAKGVYRSHQKSLVARFVQVEYEDRYRMMADLESIDFIDTYSAAFRRDRFLEMTGYDTSFPVACAEDVELSYRMSARGWKMKFVPTAIVYHTHPDMLPAISQEEVQIRFLARARRSQESQQGSERQPYASAYEAPASVRASVAGCGSIRSGSEAGGPCVGARTCGLSAQHAAIRDARGPKRPCRRIAFSGTACRPSLCAVARRNCRIDLCPQKARRHSGQVTRLRRQSFGDLIAHRVPAWWPQEMRVPISGMAPDGSPRPTHSRR